jgi:hypothetical protein
MRTAPITDNLDPMQRTCTCGCHYGSLTPVTSHATSKPALDHPGKAVLTGWIPLGYCVRFSTPPLRSLNCRPQSRQRKHR